jgi:transposase
MMIDNGLKFGLVWDNAQIHSMKLLLPLLEQWKIPVFDLPTYSPDFTIIELVINILKLKVRKNTTPGK